MNATMMRHDPPRRPAPHRWTRCLIGGVALVLLCGCSTSSASDTQSQPTSTAAPTTTTIATTTAAIAPFDRAIWSSENQDLFDQTTSAMTLFADLVEAGEADEAQQAASDVDRLMTDLADGLDDETRPAAVDLRDDLVGCSRAYGAVADALANADPEAFEASTPLFRACLGITGVDQP